MRAPPTTHLRTVALLLSLAALAAAMPAAAEADDGASPTPATAKTLDDLVSAAGTALRAGDTDRALALANEAVEADPEGIRGYGVLDARREFEKAVADYDRVIAKTPDLAAPRHARGAALLRLGRFKESVADFDKLVELAPDREPHLWERGIALYYAGEFARGARQFESHRRVNPDDVENAAWHYLCVARGSGVGAARRSLIPVSRDGRVPMMKVHELFAGKAQPKDVLTEAQAGDAVPADERKRRQFYAHLYVGLYHEAAGEEGKAREHILLAAGKYAGNDYMGDVARVHAGLLKGFVGGEGGGGGGGKK